MRLDHIAYRVADRKKSAAFFIDCLGYRLAEDLPEGFDIQFEDGSFAKCLVLLPPEKISGTVPWSAFNLVDNRQTEYHLAPEIFISDGSTGSIVKEWVERRDGIGGIHHLAYQVESVEAKMNEWKEKGYAEFASKDPLTCPGLVQVFTKPSALTGIIYELITREEHGFCKDNVKDLMESTKGLSGYGK
jgi:catechol 2,3-dioxygenase-like lactoylglutathione lyase family enzyme